MKNKLLLFAYCLYGFIQINAQNPTQSAEITAHPITDRTITFNVADEGVPTPIIWGLDTAWPDEGNIRRGVAFMGKDNIDLVRTSFQPVREIVDGKFQDGDFTYNNETYKSQKYWLDYRLQLIGLTGENTKVALNSDHPFVAPWFSPSNPATYAERWEQLIYLTAKYIQDKGRTVVSVAPFNEPDYGWQQGSRTNFYDIAGRLKNNPYFADIRISGGNTLNCDEALPWYNFLKDNLNEGNTHQLAGGFDGYANFFQKVRANGHHATADELHNVMEAMVGVEYGMQTGIWWGTAELARGEFVKASRNGKRLAYAEHRPKWTAASVYKSAEGKVQAFGGTSERQAATTTYRFLSKDRDVYYDGYGPQREYIMTLPGGTGYSVGQTNAERVVNITWGNDIQPVIDGQYVLVNRNSAKVMEVANGNTANGTIARQYNYDKGAKHQQWNVNPVDARIGGDFSYFFIQDRNSGKPLDINNNSLNEGVNIQIWKNLNGVNQQWYLDYAGDGWFYIRSRLSNKCIQVVNSSQTSGAAIQQGEKNGGLHQQWRFVAIGTVIDFEAPEAPVNLVATPNAASIRLDWSANSEADIDGYTIFRAESAGGEYNTIARNVKFASFTDNKAIAGKQYFYKIRAVDKSVNRSEYSQEVSAVTNGNQSIVAHLTFNDNTEDETVNLNNADTSGGTSYVNGKAGRAISLNGLDAFAQLPVSIANHDEISIAMWVYWKGGGSWQRIFDFGNGEDQNMYLTANANNTTLRFGIKNNDAEKHMDVEKLPVNTWSHITVTLSKAKGMGIYVNGISGNQSNDVGISPNDFKPVLNYIGRSQYAIDPFFNGYVDDFRIYNYVLSAEEVSEIVNNNSNSITEIQSNEKLELYPIPANDILNVSYFTSGLKDRAEIYVMKMSGEVVLKQVIESHHTQLDVTQLPEGIYLVRINGGETNPLVDKFIIKR